MVLPTGLVSPGAPAQTQHTQNLYRNQHISVSVSHSNTLPEQPCKRFVSHTPSRWWEHSSGGRGCSASRAISRHRRREMLWCQWLVLTTAFIQWKAWTLTSAMDTAIHENSPASSGFFSNSNFGSILCLSWEQS